MLEKLFPRLQFTNYAVTSPATPLYNCIAWAAGDDSAVWWPDSMDLGYWPPEAPRSETVDAFIEAFATIGYERCGDGDLEAGYEKVTIFVDPAGAPTHASRQLVDGSWTSKLGSEADIEHRRLDAVSGRQYGQPGVFLRRPRGR